MSNTPLNDFLKTNPDDLIHDLDFRNVVEMHLEYFKNAGLVSTIDIPPERAYEFDGNFYGLCRVLLGEGSEPMHWITMRLNGYRDPTEYTADVLTMEIVDTSAINTLKQQYRTIHYSA